MKLDALIEKLVSLKEIYGWNTKVVIDHCNSEWEPKTEVEEVYSPGEKTDKPVDTSRVFIC